MRIILVVLCLITTHLSWAQKSPSKFGDIPMEDMTMTVYDKDSSAVAVILMDYGKCNVSITSVSASLLFERHTRIKILKPEGLSWADAAISLYHSGSDEEKAINLKAVTYNLENGKIVETKMSKESVFKEKFNRNYNLQKFTLPNVKVGSVIEYSYTVSSDFLANFQNWQFQYSIPNRHSEYWAIIPDFFVMERYMQGYLAPTVYEVKDRPQSGYAEKAYHWILKNAPAFKEEPFMTSEDDYVSKINFALAYINFPNQPSQEIMGSWEKLVKNLMESEGFGKAISGSNFLKKQVVEVTAGKTTPLEKAEAIHTYVKNTLEWNGYNDFTADNLKDVFERKKGTTGDINLALASMLDKAGFTVDMVLLSTRDNGFIRQQYPMSKQLNYVVCRVNVGDKFIFLDATEKFLPIDVLPERCLNGDGLLASKYSFGWIPISTKTKTKSTVSAALSLDGEGALTGTLSYVRNGYEAQSMRRKFQQKGEKEYLKDFQTGKTWEIQNSTFTHVDSIAKDVRETHTLTLNEHASVANDIIYINPFIESQHDENPFKLENRQYPVDFGSNQENTYTLKLVIPDSHVVDELPANKMIGLPGNAGRFVYSASQMGNTINITSSVLINKALFTQTEYPQLREFYNQVVAKQAEQIVIRKK